MTDKDIKDVKNFKWAKASANMLDITTGEIGYDMLGENAETDKLGIPSKWKDQVEKIKFYYIHDPIANTVVDKIVDIAINGISNNQGNSTDEVLKVYESFKDALEDILKQMTREYLLSGLVLPEVNWYSKDFTEKDPDALIDFNIEETRVYSVPQSFWVRDPASIEVKKTPIPNRVLYFIVIDENFRYFIENRGVYADGTTDRFTYRLLSDQYPDFVSAVLRGETRYQINPYISIRRSPLPGNAYPTPYLLSVLEPLSYKRRLRKMDYSIAARVISAIQLVKMGSDEYPLTEADEGQLQDLKNEMLWRGRSGNVERVFQLIGNHTLNIEWIYPDTKALLDSGKYEAVDQDIMFGLGFPRILLTGETERSFTSDAEFAMFSPSETVEAIRKELNKFVKKLYRDVATKNNFSEYPTLEFNPLKLYDLRKMSEISKDLYEKGVLSRTSYLELSDRSFIDEINNQVRERELMKEYGIPEFAPQPFTPQPNSPDTQEINNNA